MTGLVYFVKPVDSEGPIKIGHSTNVSVRLESLMCWSPVKLEVLHTLEGSYKLEGVLHGCFADLHSHKEWFRAEPRLVEAINRLRAGEPLEAAVDLSVSYGKINNRGGWTPAKRNRLSYSGRMNGATDRLRDQLGYHPTIPANIKRILTAWKKQSGAECKFLTADEYRQLDDFLADPMAHINAIPVDARKSPEEQAEAAQ